jgi:hypothetical protein
MKVKSYTNQFEMQDPTKQYPAPEFPKQSQPVPGLARQMDPKPDHGEESYEGFGRLVEGKLSLPARTPGSVEQQPSRSHAREQMPRSIFCPAKARTRWTS